MVMWKFCNMNSFLFESMYSQRVYSFFIVIKKLESFLIKLKFKEEFVNLCRTSSFEIKL